MKVIVNTELAQYEREIGNVRHRENTNELSKFSSRLGEFSETMSELKGAMTAVKVMGGIVAFLCMAILALLSYLGTHPVSRSAIAIHEDTVISQVQNAELY